MSDHDIVRLNLGIIKRECDTCKYGYTGTMATRRDGTKTRCAHPIWLRGDNRSCCHNDDYQDWEPME